MVFGGMEIPNKELDMDARMEPQSTFGEGAMASLELGYSQTPVKALAEAYALRFFEYGGDKIQPDELNKMYPFMPEPFYEPEDRGRAAEIADRFQKRQELEKIVKEGPSGPAYGLTTFAAQMLPHAVDPINLASGMGVTAAVAKVGIAARLTAMATSTTGKAAIGAGLQATDMIIGNMPGELAAQAAEASELRGGSIETAMINSIVGAGFGMGLAGAAKGMRWLSKRGANIENMAISTSASNVHSGRAPLVDTIIKTMLDETNVKNEKYTFEPLIDKIKNPKTGVATLDQTSGVFYAAVDESHGDLQTGKTLPAGQDHLGDDLHYFTDSKDNANATSASSYKTTPGSVVEVSFEGKRVLDLDNPPDGLKDISKEMFLNGDETTSKAVVELIKDAGYDGFVYVSKEVGGMEHAPHNVVAMFNKEKIKQQASYAPDETKVKKMTPADMERINKESKSNFILTEKPSEPIPFTPEQTKSLDGDDWKHIDEKINEELAALEKFDSSDPRVKADLEEIKMERKLLDANYKIEKEGMGCLLGLISG